MGAPALVFPSPPRKVGTTKVTDHEPFGWTGVVICVTGALPPARSKSKPNQLVPASATSPGFAAHNDDRPGRAGGDRQRQSFGHRRPAAGGQAGGSYHCRKHHTEHRASGARPTCWKRGRAHSMLGGALTGWSACAPKQPGHPCRLLRPGRCQVRDLVDRGDCPFRVVGDAWISRGSSTRAGWSS